MYPLKWKSERDIELVQFICKIILQNTAKSHGKDKWSHLINPPESLPFRVTRTPQISLSDYRTWSESNNIREILRDGQNLVPNVPDSSNCAWYILLYSGPTESQHRHMCQKCPAEQSASTFLTSDWTCMLPFVNGQISVTLAEIGKSIWVLHWTQKQNGAESRTNSSPLPSGCPSLSVSKSILCSTLLVQRNLICFIWKWNNRKQKPNSSHRQHNARKHYCCEYKTLWDKPPWKATKFPHVKAPWVSLHHIYLQVPNSRTRIMLWPPQSKQLDMVMLKFNITGIICRFSFETLTCFSFSQFRFLKMCSLGA